MQQVLVPVVEKGHVVKEGTPNIVELDLEAIVMFMFMFMFMSCLSLTYEW